MKYFKIFLFAAILVIGCTDQLDVKNPNQPSPEALTSEAGIINFATGIYTYMSFENNANTFDFFWVAIAAHEAMGDAIYIPWGNFSFRWSNQVSSITLDNGTVVRPPQEGDQAISLKNRNSREQTSGNLMAHEWITMYFVNNAANLILETLEGGKVKFSGNADAKLAALKAWALWWKGYAYSRLGSMYTAGLILDESGKTNSDFVDNSALLNEAEEQFLAAIQVLQGVNGTAEQDFNATLEKIIPQHLFNGNNDTPTPQEFIRNINTMRARNLMVNTKDADKTAQSWSAIQNLAEEGLQEGDFEFVMKQDGNNFIISTLIPYRVNPGIGWHFASERMIQDFKPGDNRFTRNFVQRATNIVNQSSRGIQYGTRWNFINDGDYCSVNNMVVDLHFAGSYEENELMLAESIMNSGGDIDEALSHVDEVRNLQNAQLAAVSGTGLSLAQAKEELRRERRIGLLLRGLAFYDARRWGVIDPVAEGGGRTGCVVLAANGVLNTNATFDYKYMDYFDVPANELDFNKPSTGSAPVNENPK